jgi:hypothetical protein
MKCAVVKTRCTALIVKIEDRLEENIVGTSRFVRRRQCDCCHKRWHDHVARLSADARLIERGFAAADRSGVLGRRSRRRRGAGQLRELQVPQGRQRADHVQRAGSCAPAAPASSAAMPAAAGHGNAHGHLPSADSRKLDADADLRRRPCADMLGCRIVDAEHCAGRCVR